MKSFGRSNLLFLLLQVLLFAFFIRWLTYAHVPPATFAGTILGGIGVAFGIHVELSRQTEMPWWQKTLWLVLVTCFLVTELRAVNKDHDSARTDAREDRKHQDQQFKEIQDKQNQAFRETVGQLKAATDQLKSTDDNVIKTLVQTTPVCDIQIDSHDWPPLGNGKIEIGKNYFFNTGFHNNGDALCVPVINDTLVRVGPLEDRGFEKQVAIEFEQRWATLEKNQPTKTSNLLRRHGNSFFSTSEVFNTLPAADTGNLTFYYLTRIKYRDSSGEAFYTQSCVFNTRFQGQLEIRVTQPCDFFNRERFHRLSEVM